MLHHMCLGRNTQPLTKVTPTQTEDRGRDRDRGREIADRERERERIELLKNAKAFLNDNTTPVRTLSSNPDNPDNPNNSTEVENARTQNHQTRVENTGNLLVEGMINSHQDQSPAPLSDPLSPRYVTKITTKKINKTKNKKKSTSIRSPSPSYRSPLMRDLPKNHNLKKRRGSLTLPGKRGERDRERERTVGSKKTQRSRSPGAPRTVKALPVRRGSHGTLSTFGNSQSMSVPFSQLLRNNHPSKAVGGRTKKKSGRSSSTKRESSKDKEVEENKSKKHKGVSGGKRKDERVSKQHGHGHGHGHGSEQDHQPLPPPVPMNKSRSNKVVIIRGSRSSSALSSPAGVGSRSPKPATSGTHTPTGSSKSGTRGTKGSGSRIERSGLTSLRGSTPTRVNHHGDRVPSALSTNISGGGSRSDSSESSQPSVATPRNTTEVHIQAPPPLLPPKPYNNSIDSLNAPSVSTSLLPHNTQNES